MLKNILKLRRQLSFSSFNQKGFIIRIDSLYFPSKEWSLQYLFSMTVTSEFICSTVCFPAGSEAKASACNTGDQSSVPGSGSSPGEGYGKPTPVFLLGEYHGWRSLVGYSPWDRKESDTTERLHFTPLHA